MNRTIKLLMLSDIFVVTGFGLIQPILAIFIKDNLAGGTILAAGIASTIFLITKGAVQLPFSRYVDSHDRRTKWLITGTFFIAMVPVAYSFAESIYHIYAAQLLFGMGAGLAYPTWLGIWSTHLDRHHESFEWSLYSTLVSAGTAITALAGAALASAIGFRYTFYVVGFVSLIGCLILFLLDKQPKAKEESVANEKTMMYHYHSRRKLGNRIHN